MELRKRTQSIDKDKYKSNDEITHLMGIVNTLKMDKIQI